MSAFPAYTSGKKLTPFPASLIQANADRILDYEVLADAAFVFDEEMAQAIYELWKDPIIPTIMDHSSEFYLMDSAS